MILIYFKISEILYISRSKLYFIFYTDYMYIQYYKVEYQLGKIYNRIIYNL